MTPSADDNVLVIDRWLKAPRSLVWRTFEDPTLLTQWWGPENFTSRIELLEFYPGGNWIVVMTAPDGSIFRSHYTFIEITAPERIVYRNLPSSDAVWRGNPPKLYVNTLTFKEIDGRTHLNLRAEFASADDLHVSILGGFGRGTNQSLDRLERLLNPETE